MRANRCLVIVPPFFVLLGSHNNRVWPGLHAVAQHIGAPVWNGDWADGETYADWHSIGLNFWHLKARLADRKHAAFDDLRTVLNTSPRPDVVIIGAGDAVVPTVDLSCIQSAVTVSKIVEEELPGVYRIGYGPLAQGNLPASLGWFDAVVSGEAEEVVDWMIQEWPRGVVEGKSLSDLDGLPLLDPSLLMRPVHPINYDYVAGTRGCNYGCFFCHAPMYGRKIRGQSPRRFVDECEHRVALGTSQFYFQDLIFPYDMKRAREICRLWREELPGVEWYCESRVNTFNAEMAGDMAAASCTAVKFGVEWMLEEVSHAMDKRVDNERARRAIRECKAAGMKAIVYVLLGGLGFDADPTAQYERMYQEMASLEADHYTVGVTAGLPGSRLGIELGVMADLGRYDTHVSGDWGRFWNVDADLLDKFNGLNRAGVGASKEDANVRTYVRRVLDEHA